MDRYSDYRVVGLASLRMGENSPSGCTTYMVGDGSLNTLANFVPDSAHLLLDPETTTDFFVEDKSEVDCQAKTQGKKTIEFSTRDMGNTLMTYLFGGRASGVTVFIAPVTAQVITERGFEVITQPINNKKFKILIPRASVAVGGDLRFGKTETGTLTVTATIMNPPGGTVAPYRMILVSG